MVIYDLALYGRTAVQLFYRQPAVFIRVVKLDVWHFVSVGVVWAVCIIAMSRGS